MAEIGKLVMLLGALAFLVEAVVEVVVLPSLKWIIPDDKADMRAAIIKWAISAIGAIITVAYELDLLAEVIKTVAPELLPDGMIATVNGPIFGRTLGQLIGQILTGLLLGRGAQWFHDIGGTWLGLDGKLLKRISLSHPTPEKGQDGLPASPSSPEVVLSNEAQLAELVQQSVTYVDHLKQDKELTASATDIAAAWVLIEVTKRDLSVTSNQIASAVNAVFGA